MMFNISNTKLEFILGLIICVVLLCLYPNIHLSLLLSFIWMLYFVYRYGHKLISNYLDAGISEIKTNIEKLENKKDDLQKSIELLKDELSVSKKNYEVAIANAKTEAENLCNEKRLKIDNTIKEAEIKNKVILQSIKNEYSELIKQKLTDLIIENLIAKINDPKNVKNITLTGISRAVKELQSLRLEE